MKLVMPTKDPYIYSSVKLRVKLMPLAYQSDKTFSIRIANLIHKAHRHILSWNSTLHRLNIHMETILEQQRRLHEERERLIQLMVDEYLTIIDQEPPNQQDVRIISEHRLKALLELYSNRTACLRELCELPDDEHHHDVSSEFYARLRQIEDFHRQHSKGICHTLSISDELLRQANINGCVVFSVEEGGGRYLDLHANHAQYLNILGAQRLDYVTYLGHFDRHLLAIPRDRKNCSYCRYLFGLCEYLLDYVRRIRPLFDLVAGFAEVYGDFERHRMTRIHLDLSTFGTCEQLASLGGDRLKSALLALGLKCGGTLEERAQRLFATKGVPVLAAEESPHQRQMVSWQRTALQEAQFHWLTDLVCDQLRATKEQVQRKQARFAGEREAPEGATEPDDDDADDADQRPKRLSLDWTGQPIPRWLYRMHGLNRLFNCEICGNHTYRGPAAFRRHFGEWRHSRGMRCLGLTNTAHFALVSGIEAALVLGEKLRAQQAGERWWPETEEEFEDSHGNVVSSKTFADLKWQGCM